MSDPESPPSTTKLVLDISGDILLSYEEVNAVFPVPESLLARLASLTMSRSMPERSICAVSCLFFSVVAVDVDVGDCIQQRG